MFDSISARFRNQKNPQIINILETLYKKTSVTFEDEMFDTKGGLKALYARREEKRRKLLSSMFANFGLTINLSKTAKAK